MWKIYALILFAVVVFMFYCILKDTRFREDNFNNTFDEYKRNKKRWWEGR